MLTGGYVYAIGVEGTTLVKIGRAGNVERRLEALQTSMPHRLEILHTRWEEDIRFVEKALHRLLQAFRTRGEWFQVERVALKEWMEMSLDLLRVKLLEARPMGSPRRSTLKQWMDEHERGTGWVASKTGYSKQWISYILNGHKPFSDKLARALQETLGVQFDDFPRAKRPTKRPRTTAKAAQPSQKEV